jgi:hypothetical protein
MVLRWPNSCRKWIRLTVSPLTAPFIKPYLVWRRQGCWNLTGKILRKPPTRVGRGGGCIGSPEPAK